MAFFSKEEINEVKKPVWSFDGELAKALVRGLEEGVIVYGPDFKIISLNPAAENILEIKAGKIIGKIFSLSEAKDSEFKTMAQAMFPSLAPVVVRRSEPGADPQIIDISLEDPIKELRILTGKIADPLGKTAGFVKVFKDRTRELELLRSKSEFVTVAAHQLRTPATALNWALDGLAKESGLSEDGKESLAIARKTAHNLLEIINDLINAAQIEEGKFGYDFKEVNLPEFIDKVLQTAEPIAKEYKVKIYFNRPKNNNLVVVADPMRLGLAFSNLIDNAIKYNVENGEVAVSVKKINGSVEVSVKDTGVGISNRDLPKIFDKFFRGKNADKVATEGSGLGLYLAKNIIVRHGGKIWVESVPDRGSTFAFTLPLKQT